MYAFHLRSAIFRSTESSFRRLRSTLVGMVDDDHNRPMTSNYRRLIVGTNEVIIIELVRIHILPVQLTLYFHVCQFSGSSG